MRKARNLAQAIKRYGAYPPGDGNGSTQPARALSINGPSGAAQGSPVHGAGGFDLWAAGINYKEGDGHTGTSWEISNRD